MLSPQCPYRVTLPNAADSAPSNQSLAGDPTRPAVISLANQSINISASQGHHSSRSSHPRQQPLIYPPAFFVTGDSRRRLRRSECISKGVRGRRSSVVSAMLIGVFVPYDEAVVGRYSSGLCSTPRFSLRLTIQSVLQKPIAC